MTNDSSDKYVQNNIHIHHHHYGNRDEEEMENSAPKDNTLDVIGSIFMGIASIAVPIVIALAQQPPSPNIQNQRRRIPKQKKIKN